MFHTWKKLIDNCIHYNTNAILSTSLSIVHISDPWRPDLCEHKAKSRKVLFICLSDSHSDSPFRHNCKAVYIRCYVLTYVMKHGIYHKLHHHPDRI